MVNLHATQTVFIIYTKIDDLGVKLMIQYLFLIDTLNYFLIKLTHYKYQFIQIHTHTHTLPHIDLLYKLIFYIY